MLDHRKCGDAGLSGGGGNGQLGLEVLPEAGMFFGNETFHLSLKDLFIEPQGLFPDHLGIKRISSPFKGLDYLRQRFNTAFFEKEAIDSMDDGIDGSPLLQGDDRSSCGIGFDRAMPKSSSPGKMRALQWA